MAQELIDGVKTKQLKAIFDDRGYLMEMLRSDDEEFFEEFGQTYITVVYPGVVKAWHYHEKQTDHFIGVSGVAKVVLHDSREGSPTYRKINEFYTGEGCPLLIKIPRGVMHGFTAVGTQKAIIVNVPTAVYNYKNPDEKRAPFDDPKIGYDWKTKSR